MDQPSEILDLLRAYLPEFRSEYAVRKLALFGSAARGEAGPESDVDVLVEFEGPARFSPFMDLRRDLEALLGRKVDPVSSKALRPELRPSIERDLIHVA